MSAGQDKADKLKTHHIDVEIGNRLRQLRGAMGLTQEAVAQGLDVSATRIQNYEGGHRISASRLWQFCHLYGVSVEALFDGLPYHVGGTVRELDEKASPFENPLADEVVRAIGAAAADLSPIERRLALAALRGMGSRKLKVP